MRCRAEMTDLDREWLARKLKMYDLLPPNGRRSLQEDRRRQAAVELRQSRAEREEAACFEGIGRCAKKTEVVDAKSPRAKNGQRCHRSRLAALQRERRPRAANTFSGTSTHLHARGHQRHPHQVRARPLPHARLLAVQEDPALGRSDLPARHADPLRHRGLSREMRDQDGDRPARQAADGARHSGLRHRHELRRAVLSRPRSRSPAAPPWRAPPPARAKAA